MASKLECKKVGDTLTMHVARCEVVESANVKNKDGSPQEQVKFTDTRGDYLFIGRETADRQLARIGFADGEMVIYGDVDGTTLHFSRVVNKNPAFAPYWNVERVIPADDARNRPSIIEAAKLEVERVRQAKGLPREELSNTIGKLPFDDDAPPPSDEDSPYDDVDGMPPAPVGKTHPTVPKSQMSKAEQYFELASQVAEFQASIGKSYECPFDLASINAMAATIWINKGN